MTPTAGDSARPQAAGPAVAHPAGVTATAGTSLSASLAILLGSEDTLFRDPFADFAPSGR